MSIKEHLTALVTELDFIHSDGFSWDKSQGLPCFVTDEEYGYQINFTKKALKVLQKLTIIIFENRREGLPRIEVDNYQKIIQQTVANMFAKGTFDEKFMSGDKSAIRELKTKVELAVSQRTKLFTHYFPVWTLGFEADTPFTIGPVMLMNRYDWIEAVDFSQLAKDQYIGDVEANNNWKDILKASLEDNEYPKQTMSLAADVYGAIKDCPSLAKVAVSEYEAEYSRKLAKIVIKSALDSLSLLLGSRSTFLQLALYEERLGPLRTHKLVESDSNLWITGSSLTDRFNLVSKERVSRATEDIEEFLPSISSILNGLLSPELHSHPKLASRWATALNWFAEACRESSDSVALAKMGTSLDVLSNGGKSPGISEMVSNLLGIGEDEHIVKGDSPQTLKQLIKKIYDDGRSKILHGTFYDRLESLENERKLAFSLTRYTLISAVMNLYEYEGNDDDKAFRCMK